jgi:hypothetical protein
MAGNVSHWPTAANATFVLVCEVVRASLFNASPRLIENNPFHTSWRKATVLHGTFDSPSTSSEADGWWLFA